MTLVQKEVKAVYLGTHRVWPELPPYTPGNNTVVYYPLEMDFNDYGGGGYNLTGNNSAAITTLNGVACVDLTAGGSYSNGAYLSATVSTLPQGSSDRTNMFWVYNARTSGGRFGPYSYGTKDWGKLDGIYNNSSSGLEWNLYGGGITGGYLQPNTWYHVAITINSSGVIMYENGVQSSSGNRVCNTTGTTLRLGKNPQESGWGPLYLGDFIIEDRVRTAQEIADYFAASKSKYGL